MDRPRPVRLTREQLGTFLKTPELIRAFEAYIKALAELTPDELNDLQLSAANLTADVSALSAIVAAASNDSQAAQIAALSGQVEQLREMVAAATDDGRLLSVASQLAELRERVGMRVKRTIHDVITIATGDAEKDHTISPPLDSMNALLIFNGSYNNTGAANGGGMLLTSVSNINYSVGVGTTTPLNGRFTLMEFDTP